MSGPTAHHARKCPADASLKDGLRFLSRGMPRLTPAETQVAAVAYDCARMALWVSILGGEVEGLRAWVRKRDSGFRLSATLAEGAHEMKLLAEAKRQRDRACAGCLGLAVAFARAHRGAGQGQGRGLVLVAAGGDAIQGALEQILRGLDRYDPEYRTSAGRSCKASTFCAWYAYKGVQDERYAAADARLTQSALKHWSAVEDAERALRQSLGREPTWDEIAGAVSEHAVQTAGRVSLILRAGGESCGVVDNGNSLVARNPNPQPDEVMERAELRATIDAAAPPGSRRRRVAEAMAFEGKRAAVSAAGSRLGVEVALAEIRDALTPSLPACPSSPTTCSTPSPTPSPSPTEPPHSLAPCSHSVTPGVVRRVCVGERPGSVSARSQS